MPVPGDCIAPEDLRGAVSATPIPGTLAMTYYADGRRDEVAQGKQVGWV